MKDIIDELHWRGLIHQTTDDANLQRWLNAAGRTLYAGFDPTADSLHLGHLMGLMVLRRFQRAGHRPIALVGGATGMIGDPSGKSEERNLLDVESLRANVQGIEAQVRFLLDFEGSAAARIVNNFEWMQRFSYLDFLRDVGKNFPVNVMLAKDSVRSRLERDGTGLSYTEFSYMLLQAYDFVYLHEHFGCELQVGGSDQWGNITAGIDLARRMRSVQLYGLTWPLLTKSDGTKMGKTESGTIWLSSKRTGDYEFYQYWINVDDADAGKCLRFLTELGSEEIEAIEAEHRRAPERRLAQRRLAEEVTRLVRGEEGFKRAEDATSRLHGGIHQELKLSGEAVAILSDKVGNRVLPMARLSDGLNVVDAFVEAGLVKSKGEARRLIDGGGAYVNNERVTSISRDLNDSDLTGDGNRRAIALRLGKKKYAILIFQP